MTKNPWMKYFLDMHCDRHMNRFNLVDIYALGGSGPGPYAPISLDVPLAEREWGANFLGATSSGTKWVAVQVGASDVMKAWRPAYFGQAMARMSRKGNIGFVLVGSKKEQRAVEEAVETYRAVGGEGPIRQAIGQTTIAQLVGLLSRCDLMLTNDTGPMHLAVAAGTPVVNVSVGHVDFRETGPYGKHHWVVQPDIECGPCGFDQVCSHHTCKERVDAHAVAELCLYALGDGSFPTCPPRMRIYRSDVDADRLGTFTLHAGQEPALTSWYAQFWRRYWYEAFSGSESLVPLPQGQPPDYAEVADAYQVLMPRLEALCGQADELVSLAQESPIRPSYLKRVQDRLNTTCQDTRMVARRSLAFGPITTAFFRDTHNLSQPDLHGMMQEHAQAYATWRNRMREIGTKLMGNQCVSEERSCYAGTT